MPGSSVSGTSGQVPEVSRPATWPTSHTRPPTTTTVPMASSSRVSLAWWRWSWAQARHWHSGRSGRIAATSLRPGRPELVAAADQPEEGLVFLGVEGDQQPYRRLPAPACQPRAGPLAVLAGGQARRGDGEVGVVLELSAGRAAFA